MWKRKSHVERERINWEKWHKKVSNTDQCNWRYVKLSICCLATYSVIPNRLPTNHQLKPPPMSSHPGTESGCWEHLPHLSSKPCTGGRAGEKVGLWPPMPMPAQLPVPRLHTWSQRPCVWGGGGGRLPFHLIPALPGWATPCLPEFPPQLAEGQEEVQDFIDWPEASQVGSQGPITHWWQQQSPPWLPGSGTHSSRWQCPRQAHVLSKLRVPHQVLSCAQGTMAIRRSRV